MSTRQSCVAGTYYPDDPTGLSKLVGQFLGQVGEQSTRRPKILISPHAGFIYSGQVAASGFKLLENISIDTVVLLGNSHQGRFYQAVIYPGGIWETPLGKIEVDTRLSNQLMANSKLIVRDETIHGLEHSLEVQLPFLQTVLGSFKIVPILLGNDSKEKAQELADVLAENLNPQTILIASSDLSHYPPYEIANTLDTQTIEAILSRDVKRLELNIHGAMQQNYPNLVTCACGEGVIKTAMYLANKIGAHGTELLKYANSGDVTGDKTQVVGYASISFYAE